MIGWLRIVGATTVVLVSAAYLTGCAEKGDGATETAATPTTTQTSAPGPTSTTTVTSPAPPSGVSDGENYSLTMIPVEGSTPDGKGKWRVEVGQLAGGDPAVVVAFNKASRASANYLINQFDPSGPVATPWKFEAGSEVKFGKAFVAQVTTGSVYTEGAAHPVGYVSTVVIDSRTARPITLGDLFTDEQQGLNKLSEQTKILFPKLSGSNTVMADLPGNAAKAENFANWVPTVEGMEVHFGDYQLGPHGLVVLTVPWSALTPLLAPDMTALTKG